MKCPICYYQDTKVVDSRAATDGLSIRRRRECLKCGFRFSTYEEIEILDLMIVKRDGGKESYNRDKLMKGLKKALEKRSITEDKFKKLIEEQKFGEDICQGISGYFPYKLTEIFPENSSIKTQESRKLIKTFFD